MNRGGGGAGGLQPPKFWAGGEIWAKSVFTKVFIFILFSNKHSLISTPWNQTKERHCIHW